MLDKLKSYQIILASKSPRRKQLLAELGIQFTVESIDTEEDFPIDIPVEQVAEYLAVKKAKPFENRLNDISLIITADTIVVLGNEIMGKPDNYNEAYTMIEKLSGKAHRVLTGVCVMHKSKQECFTSSTTVYFKKLSHNEIDYYISHYRPYDKAGAYGIQEWIGYIAVERIEGSYFNVMGLPVQHLYEVLRQF